MLNCIQIDNERHSGDLLKDYCSRISFLNLTDSFKSPLNAIPVLQLLKTDLVFLDIYMEDIHIADFIKYIPVETKIVVLSTEFKSELESFNLPVFDFIGKPYSFEKFFETVKSVAKEKGVNIEYL